MSELQDAISQNVRVLIALRGMRSQRELARAVGVEYTNFNAKVRGGTAWTINDIEMLADYFRIKPAALLGDGREFLDPGNRLRATGTSGGPSSYVPDDVTGSILVFPQVTIPAGELAALATVIPFPRGGVHHRSPRPSRSVAV